MFKIILQLYINKYISFILINHNGTVVNWLPPEVLLFIVEISLLKED